jgi:hypothetical protein
LQAEAVPPLLTGCPVADLGKPVTIALLKPGTPPAPATTVFTQVSSSFVIAATPPAPGTTLSPNPVPFIVPNVPAGQYEVQLICPTATSAYDSLAPTLQVAAPPSSSTSTTVPGSTTGTGGTSPTATPVSATPRLTG